MKTFEAVRRGSSLRFRCDYCRKYHYHGAMGPNFGDGDGHRSAHCRDGSPYNDGGYLLKEVRK